MVTPARLESRAGVALPPQEKLGGHHSYKLQELLVAAIMFAVVLASMIKPEPCSTWNFDVQLSGRMIREL
jgi:hypothetical protein